MAGDKKYQYSVFPAGNRDEQFVIRTDTFQELKDAKKEIDQIVNQRQAVASTQPAQPPQTEEQVHTCPIHHVPLQRKEGQFGVFYSHYLGKDQAGKSIFCKGK